MAAPLTLVIRFDHGLSITLPGASEPLVVGSPVPDEVRPTAERLGMCCDGAAFSEIPFRTIATLGYARRDYPLEVPTSYLLRTGFPHRDSIHPEMPRHFESRGGRHGRSRTADRLVLTNSWRVSSHLNPQYVFDADERQLAVYLHVGIPRRPPALADEIRDIDAVLALGKKLDEDGWPGQAWNVLAAALTDLPHVSDATRIELLCAITGVELQLGRRDLATTHLDWLRQLTTTSRPQLIHVVILHLHSILELQRGDLDAALKFDEDALELLGRLRKRKISPDEYLRRCDGIHGTLGETNARLALKDEGPMSRFIRRRSNSNAKAALTHLKKGHGAVEELGDRAGIARSCMRKARLAFRHWFHTDEDTEAMAMAERERQNMTAYPGFIYDRSAMERELFLAERREDVFTWMERLVSFASTLANHGYGAQIEQIKRALHIAVGARGALGTPLLLPTPR